MIERILVLLYLICATQVHATVRHSSDLGWTAGQDVSTQFAALLSGGTIKAGDELKLLSILPADEGLQGQGRRVDALSESDVGQADQDRRSEYVLTTASCATRNRGK